MFSGSLWIFFLCILIDLVGSALFGGWSLTSPSPPPEVVCVAVFNFLLLFLLGFQFILVGFLWVGKKQEELGLRMQMQNYGIIGINCQLAEQLEWWEFSDGRMQTLQKSQAEKRRKRNQVVESRFLKVLNMHLADVRSDPV